MAISREDAVHSLADVMRVRSRSAWVNGLRFELPIALFFLALVAVELMPWDVGGTLAVWRPLMGAVGLPLGFALAVLLRRQAALRRWVLGTACTVALCLTVVVGLELQTVPAIAQAILLTCGACFALASVRLGTSAIAPAMLLVLMGGWPEPQLPGWLLVVVLIAAANGPLLKRRAWR